MLALLARTPWRPTSALRRLEEAIACYGKPDIFNTDQGSQFTSFAFTNTLRQAGIHISMDGRGRTDYVAEQDRMTPDHRQQTFHVIDVVSLNGPVLQRVVSEHTTVSDAKPSDQQIKHEIVREGRQVFRTSSVDSYPAADALRRARWLPIGADRNALRQLAMGSFRVV
jgi:hypothetical protein